VAGARLLMRDGQRPDEPVPVPVPLELTEAAPANKRRPKAEAASP